MTFSSFLKLRVFIVVIVLSISSFTKQKTVEWVSTTREQSWKVRMILKRWCPLFIKRKNSIQG
jgi:hypothetical protein